MRPRTERAGAMFCWGTGPGVRIITPRERFEGDIMKHRLLIVDDDEEIRTQMKWALADQFEVAVAEDRDGAMARFQEVKPVVTLLDLGLPPRPNDAEEGMATLAGFLELDRSAKIIVISGQNEAENARRAVGEGAYDFHTKPVDMDALRFLLQRCVYVAELEREYREMKQGERVDIFEGILGASPAMQRVFATIRKVAAVNVPVLILGESGTGKEMVAKAIHRQSVRRKKPFVALNCSAIPQNLIESELFGHERGAFTGAHAQRRGLVETASAGTLFLDEIGDLPAPVQIKLLRFLQERRIQRVGGREELEIDTRIVAATNIDLDAATREGSFREDLYFRLAVVICRLPALRERGEDILLLARDFLTRFDEQNGQRHLTFDREAEAAIEAYPWPGNVRELQNRVQRAVIMTDGKRITVQDLELAPGPKPAARKTLKEAREEMERELVERVLRRHHGKVTAASAELGISRPTLYDLMDRLGLARKPPGNKS